MVTLAEWQSTWNQLDLPCPSSFAELKAHYDESHRAYHTLRHLRECFDHLDSVRHLAERAAEIELAIWFHDAVYDPRHSDNEERSAVLAAEALIGAGADQRVMERIQNLILATKHTVIPTDPDAKFLVDIDLAILGAEVSRFDEYEQQIRHEYAWVPEVTFRQGRSSILSHFLNRPQLYLTDWFAERFEQSARGNLGRSLQQLRP